MSFIRFLLRRLSPLRRGRPFRRIGFLVLLAISSFIASLFSACSRIVREPEIEYAVEVNIENGYLTAKDTLYPVLHICCLERDAGDNSSSFEGVPFQDIQVVVDNAAFPLSGITDEDGSLVLPLLHDSFLTTGAHEVTVTAVFPQHDGTRKVWNSGGLLVMVDTAPVSSARCRMTTSAGETKTFLPGETIRLSEGESGKLSFEALPNDCLVTGQLCIEDEKGLRLIGVTSKGSSNGVMDCSFVSEKVSSSSITYKVSTPNGEKEFYFPFVVEAPGGNDEPETGEPDDGEPSRTPVAFSVSSPSVVFAGYNAEFVLTPLSFDADLIYSLAVTLDGEAVPFLVSDSFDPTALGAETLREPFAVTLDGEVVGEGGKVHDLAFTLSEVVRPEDDGRGEQFTETVRMAVRSLWTEWTGYPSGDVIREPFLWVSKEVGQFRLRLVTDCVDGEIENATLRCDDAKMVSVKESGKIGSWIFKNPVAGVKNFEITIRTPDRVFTLPLKATVGKRYTLEFRIDGSNLYAVHTGPGKGPDIPLDFRIYAVLRGVIPYTTAVKNANGYELRKDYEYHDFQWLKKEWSLTKGDAYRTETLQQGWINTAINYAKTKLKGLKAESGRATRWVKKNGVMVEEYYTPTPYLRLDCYIFLNEDNGVNMDYVDLELKYDSVSEFMKGHGAELIVSWW